MATNSYVQVPPDSTGKKVYHKQHVVGGQNVQVPVLHIADKFNSDNILAIDANGAELISFAEGQPALAGFGSLKVSNNRALGVYESSMDSYDDLFYVQEANGGTSTYFPVQSSVVLATTTSVDSKVTRTTNRYHYYLPGTSNLIVITCSCGDTGKTGNVRRWGAFDGSDGVFFELYEDVLNVVVRSSTSGSVVENKVPFSQWDVSNSPFASDAQNLDVTKVNVWWIDYQWLGAGRVRFGYHLPNGQRVVLHTIEHAGNVVVPYMRTGTLPLRTENHNFSVTGASSELREVCMAVYIEGNFEDYTFWRHCGGIITNTVNSPNDMLVSYRMVESLINGKHNSVIAYPETLSIFSDQPVSITMWQGVSIVSGDTWVPVNTSTLERLETGEVNVTGARPLFTALVGAGVTNFELEDKFEVNDEGIMVSSNEVSEIWTITATPLTVNPAQVTVNMSFRELW